MCSLRLKRNEATANKKEKNNQSLTDLGEGGQFLKGGT